MAGAIWCAQLSDTPIGQRRPNFSNPAQPLGARPLELAFGFVHRIALILAPSLPDVTGANVFNGPPAAPICRLEWDVDPGDANVGDGDIAIIIPGLPGSFGFTHCHRMLAVFACGIKQVSRSPRRGN